MKKYLVEVISSLTVAFLIAFIAVFWEWLTSDVTLSRFWLFVIAIIPITAYFLLRSFVGVFQQAYKTGDLVNIIADERQFMLVRYHFWLPKYAVCKLVNQTDSISIHQKYLTPYFAPQKSVVDSLFSNLNINKDVKTGTIKYL